MSATTAAIWYHTLRGLAAYTITGYVKKHRNQHATTYTFADDSQLIIYKDMSVAYRNFKRGFIMAVHSEPRCPA